MLKSLILISTLLQPLPEVDLREVQCLTQALHFEARGEPYLGKKAVANVIMNRVKLNRYSNTVCEVIAEPWQFSYRNDDAWRHHRVKLHVPAVRRSLLESAVIAYRAVAGELKDVTKGATHFVNLDKASPSWRYALAHRGKFGKHDMFKES